MRVGATEADGLSSEVTAALTLSELQSEVPGQLQGVGDELDQVGIVITARADLVDGFVLDPGVLAADLGISLEQAEEALAAFGEVEGGRTATITPFLDALVENRIAAEVLRGSFVNLPEFGTDPEVDQVLLRLAPWLPGALDSGELPTLTKEQVLDLQTLAALVDPNHPEGFLPFGTLAGIVGAVGLSLDEMAPDTLREFSLSVFNSVARAFELDGRLTKAAGLPTIADLIFRFQKSTDSNPPAPPEWAALDSWLPAFLAGEGPASTDASDLAMAAALAGYVGFDGGTPAEALDYLKNGRFLQKSLIPGEFEDLDSPMIPITMEGLGMAILAGQRNGVLTEEGRAQIDALVSQVLNNPNGTGPIELSEEQQQTLIGVVIGQNGEEFLEDPVIQRQLIAALNLIGRQPTLELQQKAFGDAIEAFRSLAVVGAPAVTYRQLRQAVGQKVDDELSYSDLTARSSKRVGKRPFYLSLLANWGVPGSDKIKTKKRKFSYEFDETGELVRIRKKKISKWKRFKNTLKAFGKAWKQGWKDNPWKALFDTVKIAASVVATIFPPTSGVGLAAITVLAADTAIAIADGDVLGAISSAFGAVGGAAAYFGNVAVAGSTAQLVQQGADLGGKIVDGIQSADNLIDAIDDGNILGAIGSGFGLLGNVADVVATGAEFADGVGGVFTGGGLFSDETLKTVVDTANEVGQTANDLKDITEGVGTTIKAAEDGDIAGAIIGGVGVLGKGLEAATNQSGILDDGLGISETFAENQETLSKIGTSLVDVSNAGATAAATVEAIENDDIIGALSNGVKFAGDAATIVGDDKGFVGGAVGIEGDTAKNLTEFGETGSRQFAEGIELTGSAIEGDVLGVIENTIDLSQLSAEEKSRLAGQLKAADSVLDVARVVESVYDGGDVDLDKLYDEVNEALKDISEIPEEPPPPPPPPPVPAAPVQGQSLAGGTVVGRTADGAILIDNNGDGRPDAALRPAASGVGADSAPALGPDGSPLPQGPPGPGDGIDRSVGGRPGSVTIQPGQSLSAIAAENGTTVEALLELNPQITDPNTIQADQQLVVRPPVDLAPGGALLDPSAPSVQERAGEQLRQQLVGPQLEQTPLIDLLVPAEFGPVDGKTAAIENVGDGFNALYAAGELVATEADLDSVLGPVGDTIRVGPATELGRLGGPVGVVVELGEIGASALDENGNFDPDAVGEQTAGAVGSVVGGAVGGLPGSLVGETIATDAHQRFTYEPLVDSQYLGDIETVVTRSSTGPADGFVPHGVAVSQVTVDDGTVAQSRVRIGLPGGDVELNPDQVDRLLSGGATIDDWARTLGVPPSEALDAAKATEQLFEDTNAGLDTPNSRRLPEDFGGIHNLDSTLFPVEEIFPQQTTPDVI